MPAPRLYRRQYRGRARRPHGQWANQQPVWENATPPCNFICPAGNDVQGFLAALTEEDVDGALEILLRDIALAFSVRPGLPGFLHVAVQSRRAGRAGQRACAGALCR